MGAVATPQRSPGSGRSASKPLLARADLPWLAGALLIAVGLRIAWVTYLNIDPNDGRFDDSVFYHNTAHLLALGVGYDDPYGRGVTAQWPPAYPAALAVLYKLFGWHLVLAKGLNIAAAAVTIVLVYLTAARIFDRRVAFLAAIVLAAFPGQIYFSTLVYTETTFAMIFTLVLLLALVWTVQRPDGRWWQVLIIGFLIGVAAMTRAEGLFLAAVLVAVWTLTVRPWRKVLRYGALTAFAVVLTLTPWTVRNAVQLHEFIPLRSGAGDAIARALDPDAELRGERRSIAEGLRYNLTHPWEVPAVVAGRIHRLYANDSWAIWNIQTFPASYFRGDYELPLTQEEEGRWRNLADPYFFAVGAAALVGVAICLLRRNRASLIIIVAVLGWTLLFGYLQPVTRYHFPLEPFMAILAAAFAVFAWDRLAPIRRSLLGRAKGEQAAASGAGPSAGGPF